MRSRVIPGSLVTMARRVPVKRLKSVDLPTLGRPTMTSDGRRSGISSRAGRTTDAAARRAIFQCSAFPVVQIEEPICLGCAGSVPTSTPSPPPPSFHKRSFLIDLVCNQIVQLAGVFKLCGGCGRDVMDLLKVYQKFIVAWK